MKNILLSGEELSAAIKAVVNEGDVRCAVAFWGAGASNMFENAKNRKVKIICNLASGGTNPDEVKKLQKKLGADSVKQYDTLHAKVYIGSNNTVITSANASANGLGFEEQEQAKWLEAGVLIKTTDALVKWFDELFDGKICQVITKDDLERAKEKWKFRQANKPPLPSFEDYRVDEKFPLLAWVFESDKIKYVKESFENHFSFKTEVIKAKVENGLELSSEDEFILFEGGGRWVIYFHLSSNNVNGRKSFSWNFCDYVIKDCYYYNDIPDVKYSCAVSLTENKSGLFEMDPHFKKCFKSLIESDDYRLLLGNYVYDKKILNLMKRFWVELTIQYKTKV